MRDVRDQVVDFVRRWSEKTEISVGRFISWLGVTVSKFYNWRQRYGRVNEQKLMQDGVGAEEYLRKKYTEHLCAGAVAHNEERRKLLQRRRSFFLWK